MAEVKYLTLDEVVTMQDELVERTGGSYSPLIHRDKLESAMRRPANAAHYEGADLVRQAVALAVGISQAQAFLDGNKRAAFAAADSFLRINGMAFRGDPLAIAARLEAVAEASGNDARRRAEADFAGWVGPVDPSGDVSA